MNTVQYMYRCRRCGDVYGEMCGGEDYGLGYLLKAIAGDDNGAMDPALVSAHYKCDDGGAGVADLVGYRLSND